MQCTGISLLHRSRVVLSSTSPVYPKAWEIQRLLQLALRQCSRPSSRHDRNLYRDREIFLPRTIDRRTNPALIGSRIRLRGSTRSSRPEAVAAHKHTLQAKEKRGIRFL